MKAKAKIYIDFELSQLTITASRFPVIWKRLVEQLIPASDRKQINNKLYAFRVQWVNTIEWISAQCFDVVDIYDGKDEGDNNADTNVDHVLISQLKTKIIQLEKQHEECKREHKINADANDLMRLLRGSYLLPDVYKLLAKHNHPDITKDDGSQMKEINVLFDRLQKPGD